MRGNQSSHGRRLLDQKHYTLPIVVVSVINPYEALKICKADMVAQSGGCEAKLSN